MLRSPSLALIAGLAGAVVATPAGAELTVTLITGAGRSLAGDGSGPDVANVAPFASPPFASGPVSASDGGGTSTTEYTFTNAAWRIDFTHARPGNGSGVYVWSDDFSPGPGVTFGVSKPVVALLSGSYQVADTGAGDNTWFEARLWENGVATLLHHTYNLSVSTTNETFTLGEAGGDHTNFVTGARAHLLVPGVPYTLEWYAGLQDGRLDPGDTGASATGFYRIDFLPEPASAGMLGAGVAALAVLARRRGHRAPADR